jgi:hypothetical protein
MCGCGRTHPTLTLRRGGTKTVVHSTFGLGEQRPRLQLEEVAEGARCPPSKQHDHECFEKNIESVNI